MNNLEECRKKIDEIDSQILNLLADRNNISKEIGNFKKQNKFEVIDKKREQEIFSRLKVMGEEDGLDKEFVQNIFKLIIRHSREVQG